MAIGSLPPVTNEIQANSGQPGKTLAQQTAANALLDVQAAATTEPVVAIVPETTLIEKAVAEALGRQGGLAPLYATLAELADAPDLPDTVKAAINMVLAFRLGDGNVTPERVAEAIRSSGLFHEAVAAGRMAAVLPPAIRQALGGVPEEKRQTTARPATSVSSSAASTAAAARPVLAAASPLPPASGAPSPTAGAQLGQGGSPPLQAAAIASPAGTPVSSSGGAPVPANASPGASAGTVVNAPATGVASPLAGAVTPPTSTTAQAQPVATGETPPAVSATARVVASPLSPTATTGHDGTSPLPAQRMPSVGDGGAMPTPQSTGGAVPSSSPTLPASSAPAAPAPDQPVSAQPSLAAIARPVPTDEPVSDPGGVRPSPPPSPPTQQPAPGNAAASSRTFAPWTPGRPLTSAPVPTASATSTASPPAAGHPVPSPAPLPQGGEAAPLRAVGDKALFVPSTVDSLPNASPGTPPRVTAGPATPSAAAGAPVQPNAGQPMVSAQPFQPGSEPDLAAGQGGVTPSPQAPQQIRSGVAAGVDPGATSPRQFVPPATPTAVSVTMPAMAGVDLKGALEGLRRELAVWLGRNANVLAGLGGGGDDSTARVDRPTPPRKGGPVRGQPAVPFLDGDHTEAASTETLAGRALGEAERSLSRVFLHQAATAESRDARVAQSTPALMFEIPIAGPNGTSIAQLRIERDDHAPTEPGAAPRRVFQVDIAFDIAPLGPVAVRVGLMDGRRVAVGVWCESDDGLVRMEAERENIVLGLEQEGMVVAGLDLHRGHPPEGREDATAAASHRLDLQL